MNPSAAGVERTPTWRRIPRERGTPSGVSLLEAVLVLAVMALLGAGLASVGRVGAQGAVADAGAAVLRDGLAEARARALSLGVVVRVIVADGPEGAGGVFWIAAATPAGGWAAIGGARSLPAGVVLRTADGSAGEGMLWGSASTFSGRATFTVEGVPRTGSLPWNYVEFRPAGTALPCLLVLDHAADAALPTGGHEAGRRGLRVSVYGAVTLLPGPECF